MAGRWGRAALTVVIAVGLALGATGCEVERDLDPARFACGFGGPCPAGDAGAPADGGGGGVDSGVPDLNGCVGRYDGFSVTGTGALVEAILTSTGRMTFTFTKSSAPLSPVVVPTQIEADYGIVVRGVSRATLSGLFEPSTCSATGSWTDGNDSGSWNVERER